jgi:ubiquinone/menaquinone biosynthesis C-methylase UbiE
MMSENFATSRTGTPPPGQEPVGGNPPASDHLRQLLRGFLKDEAEIDWSHPVPRHASVRLTPATKANARFFDTNEWASDYFRACHRDDQFRSRWTGATGSWDDQVVVDIGCGPGNVFATVGGSPKTLIGVDISAGSLEMARSVGYQSLLADAHDLPLASAIADIVVVNATLHHCEDMSAVLKEAARLVAPGGLLVTDHDPQQSAWNLKGPGKWLWDLRLLAYRWLKRGIHRSSEMQIAPSTRKFTITRETALPANYLKACSLLWALISKFTLITMGSEMRSCKVAGADQSLNTVLASACRSSILIRGEEHYP